MNFKRIILSILSIFLLCGPAAFAEQWRLHPSYSGNVARIVETPLFSYILSYSEPYYGAGTDNAVPALSLFRYDKEADELTFLNAANGLSSNRIARIEYNKERRYLMVAYLDGNIDLLHDDGKKTNIPGLKVAGEEYSKNVNAISFDPASGLAYLATDFGYITVDDRKGTIASTRDFGVKVQAIARFGPNVYLGLEDGLFRGSPDSRSFADFSRVGAFTDIKNVLTLGSGVILVRTGEGWGGMIYRLRETDAGTDILAIVSSWIVSLEKTRDGALAPCYYSLYEISSDGSVREHRKLSEDESDTAAGSWLPGEFRINRVVKGIAMLRSDAAGSWTELDGGMLPNASSAFRCTAMRMHPDRGLLVRNHGIDHNFNTLLIDTPDLLSAYKGLEWTPLSNYFNAWSAAFRQRNPNGIAIDPLNPDHVYSGSALDGILRVDLADPSRSIRMGREGDPAKGTPGFAAILPDDRDWDLVCHFSPPEFDEAGNLWFAHYVHERRDGKNPTELWYWTPDDRSASTSASALRPWRKWVIEGIESSLRSFIKPLRRNENRNILFLWPGYSAAPLVLIDHKGTLDNRSDDLLTVARTLHDHDGATIRHDAMRSFYEDTQTGEIWLGHSSGVIKLDPADFSADPGLVERIKVARNDGTQLADYLLDGVPVDAIDADASGRKWFGTPGGIVVTDATGTEILKSYNTENSPLPANEIYALCYNPENRSMMVSTGGGLAELFLATSPEEGEDSDIRIYPNPVRPDFFGEVTIDGLPDNALVKIVNSAAGLVRELPRAQGGETKWNVTDMNSKRVKSGVYYVLASSAPDGASYSNVGKILVVN